MAVCVHVYWKGILVQRVAVHTYEFGLNFPRGSREGEEDLNLRRKWESIIPTCNAIFKLMVCKQHAHTHVYRSTIDASRRCSYGHTVFREEISHDPALPFVLLKIIERPHFGLYGRHQAV
jgi:hypothetical protein